MPEINHERDDENRDVQTDAAIDQDLAVRRVERLLDDGELLYAVVRAGEDDESWYFIAIRESEYEGRMYLKERYVRLTKPGVEADDTWMSNGIDRRCGDASGPMASVLAQAYASVSNIESMYESGEVGVEDVEAAIPKYHDPTTGGGDGE